MRLIEEPDLGRDVRQRLTTEAALWAGGGGIVGRFIAGERTHRIVSVCLAALLAATVAYVWI